jgi:serine/threonine-protein kinase
VGTTGTTAGVIADRYLLEEICGHGSYGRVFRGRDLVQDRPVALKEFVRHTGRADGFLRELGVLFELEHPHIIACHSLVMNGTYRYLVYEFMDGGSLRDQLELASPDPIRLIQFLLEAMAGVAVAHGRDIIHRDLKPENILLRRQPDGALIAKVSDFGIAAMGVAAASRSSIGSPAYMAPEQFFDAYDHRVDVYALGVMLYEIICGRRPFYGSPAQIMMAHVKRNVDVPTWVPRTFTRILKRALAKQPERRFDSIAALAEAVTIALRREGNLLTSTTWPAQVGTIDALAATRAGIFVAGGGAIRQYDRGGRLVDERRGDQVVATDAWYLIRDGAAAYLCSEQGQRKLGELPHGAHLALSRDGSVLIAHAGGVQISEGGVRTQVVAEGGDVLAASFVGPAAQLGLARRTAGGARIEWGTVRVDLPEAIVGLWGHPLRDELIARSAVDPERLYLVRPHHVVPIRADCGDFTCDGETFLAVTRDGELASLAPSSGRLARTRWEKPLHAVAACTDNLAWVTRSGHLRALSFSDGGSP